MREWSIRQATLWARACLSFLYPPSCVSCKAPTPYTPGLTDEALWRESFCAPCQEQVFKMETHVCPICGHPQQPHHLPHPCHTCLRDPPAFRQARGLYVYEGAIRTALHQFKYRKDEHAGRVLCQLFASQAIQHLSGAGYDLIIPVPLHPQRLRQRGFQQAWMLLAALPTSIPKRELLVRTKQTRTQVRLGKWARDENLRAAFQVKQGEGFEGLRGARVLLIDDVITTGATAQACAIALLEAGAKVVDVLALCRAIL